LVIGFSTAHRIAGILKVNKINPLDHPSVFDIQAWNDAFVKHFYVIANNKNMVVMPDTQSY